MVGQTQKYVIAVIGAGPAGIMAAIFAARSGSSVVLLEKNDKIGRKILATGNGRCNLTNNNIDICRYHGEAVTFAEPIFASFDQFETMKFFENLGVVLKKEDHGRIFPRTNQASTVVDALEHELKAQNVEIKTNFCVKKITPPSPSSPTSQNEYNSVDRGSNVDSRLHGNDKLWQIESENQTIIANRIILTTGGKAAHQFGSSGDGLFWAKNLGHTIVPIHAALVPVEVSEPWISELMGIKLAVLVKLITNEKRITSREGDLIFTHFGVSGPAVMGLAREIDPELTEGKQVMISIDLLPDLPSEKLDILIENQIRQNSKKLISNIIIGFVPKNLAPRVLTLANVRDKKAAEISKSDRKSIISVLKDFRLTVRKVRPLKEAQVTAGGIATSEIQPTLKSKIISGLYFAGEILDIDGDSGGFNLQWAWSSGKVAGENAAKE